MRGERRRLGGKVWAYARGGVRGSGCGVRCGATRVWPLLLCHGEPSAQPPFSRRGWDEVSETGPGAWSLRVITGLVGSLHAAHGLGLSAGASRPVARQGLHLFNLRLARGKHCSIKMSHLWYAVTLDFDTCLPSGGKPIQNSE